MFFDSGDRWILRQAMFLVFIYSRVIDLKPRKVLSNGDF